MSNEMQKVELNFAVRQRVIRLCSTSVIYVARERIVLESSAITGDFNGKVDRSHRRRRDRAAIGSQGRVGHPNALRAEWALVGGGGGVSEVEGDAA